MRVGVVEVLLERHGDFLPASADDDRFDVQRALGPDRDVDVRATDAGRRLRHCVRLDVVARNPAGRRFPRRIRDYLEQPRHVPVLVQRMICLRGGHVKRDVVSEAIGKSGGKRRQV